MLNEAELVGDGLCQGKTDYGKDKFIFHGLVLAPKIEFVITINKYGIIQAPKIFKRCTEFKRLLDHVQNFKMVECKKKFRCVTKYWKKTFGSGIIIPTKMKCCKKYVGRSILRDECNLLVNKIKQVEGNLNLLQRKPSNHFGHMLPYYREEHDLFFMWG